VPAFGHLNLPVFLLNSIAFKEKRLTDQRRDSGRLVGLRYQKRRLGPFPGQEALGIGGDEDHRHLERIEEIVDGIDTGTAIGELNIRQDETRRLNCCWWRGVGTIFGRRN
jgi:hypothetical protein